METEKKIKSSPYMVIEDSVDYRTIAAELNKKYNLSANHARIRSIYLSGMKKLIGSTMQDIGLSQSSTITDEAFEQVMHSPSFHELMSDLVDYIKKSKMESK